MYKRVTSQKPTELRLILKDEFDSEIIEALKALLPDLEVFEVVGPMEYASAICALLAQGPKLRELVLNGGALRDLTAFTAVFANNTTLTSAKFCSNDLEDVTPLCELLKRNTTLKHNKISDVKALGAALKQNTTLRRLELLDNKIMKLEGFTTNTGLKVLDVDDNLLDCDCHVANIANGFETLSIGHCYIKSFNKLAEALKTNTSIRHLHIGNERGATVDLLSGPGRLVTLCC